MKILEAALAPLTVDDLLAHYQDGNCLKLEGTPDKFTSLVTLSDIERQLNNGANATTFAQVIEDGQRKILVDSNTAWTVASLKKAEFMELIENGSSFMLANSSQVSRGLSALCDDIEECFADDKVHADVHLYISMNSKGGSYNAHRDVPQHKILLQAVGDAHWQLFEPKEELPANVQSIEPSKQDELLKMVSEFTLKQGDLLYMPPGMFHRVTHVAGPRISISIPFYTMPEAAPMDRTYIPFAKMFTSPAE